jgi:phosphatidylserine/phosphatidylglycerophosphate/cardiolipin synthase-like enzyme
MKKFAVLGLVLAMGAGCMSKQTAGTRATAGIVSDLPVGGAELVQTVPEETDLAQPDLAVALPTWIEMIRQAKESIDTSQFYVSSEPGAVLEPVIDELVAAGKRGVKIRFIVEKSMVDNDKRTLQRVREIPGIDLRVVEFGKVPGGGGIQHAKYWIIDHKTIYVGSDNFDWRALQHIHETAIRIHDVKLAAQLTQIFNIDFEIAQTGKVPSLEAGPLLPATGDGAIELVANPVAIVPSNVRPAIHALIELIGTARRSIRVQLLDYSTVPFGGGAQWKDLDDALRAAGARGVKVEIIVSNWNTRPPGVNSIKSLTQAPNVEVRLATIPRHSSGFIPYARVVHSKYMVVDGETLWIGTSNWSKDYFYNSRGIELIAHRPALAEQGARIFETLWGSKYAERVDPAKKYPAMDPGKP